MRYYLEIDTSNAAFEPNPGLEIARILREAANRIEQYTFNNEKSEYPLKEINGNTCGFHGYSHNERV